MKGKRSWLGWGLVGVVVDEIDLTSFLGDDREDAY